MHLIALRPEPGLTATLEKARALGLAITGHALSEIRAVGWDCPDPAGIDGLLIGSANAIAHAGPQVARFAGKPVYAVGEATAAAARAAGFTLAMTGTGGLQGVLDAIAGPCHLLRIAGEEHVPLTPPAGVTFDQVTAYRSVMIPLDPVAPVLTGDAPPLVLLHSAATARHFAQECERLGIARAAVTLAGLGPRITAAAGSGWAGVHTPERPDEAALLQLAFDLCRQPRSIRAASSCQP